MTETNEPTPLDSADATSTTDNAMPVDSRPTDLFRMRIYDPSVLTKAIQALTGKRDEDDDVFSPLDERPREVEAHLSNEETLLLRRLRLLEDERRGPWRTLIRASTGMIARLAMVRRRAPHFAPFVDLVTRAAQIAIATDTPLHLPPILLLGEPGIGKTFVAKQVAAAIGSSFNLFPMNQTDAFRLRGLNTAWKGARPGRVAESLLTADSASPVILLDELEKAPALDRVERPFDIWHSLWEPENSIAFVDDYYELPFRCDHVIWIASANSLDPLPDSILDRLLILRIPEPDPDQVLVIIDNMYKAKRLELRDTIAKELAEEVCAALAGHTPRRAGRILDLALGFMASERRTALCLADVHRAAAIAKNARQTGTFRHPVGFKAG